MLDGNVRRVLSRLFAYDAPPTAAGDAPLWEAARGLVRGGSPGDVNQAIMELGAVVCTPRTPRCDACPVASRCAARLAGRPERFPRPRPAKPAVAIRVGVGVVEHRGRVLLVRAGKGNPLRGAWDFPAVALDGGKDAAAAVVAAVRARHGLRCRALESFDGPSHAILAMRLRLVVVRASAVGPVPRSGLRWIRPGEFDAAAVSSASRKALAASVQNRSRIPGTGPGPRSRRRRGGGSSGRARAKP